MKKFIMLIAAVLVLGVTVVSQGNVKAATNDLACEVYARSYSIGADTVTANFEVKKIDSNADSCTKDVSVAAWNAPNGTDGAPFNQQTFVDSKSGTFAPGFHSLTVKKPKCFYQIDLIRGLNPYGAGGSGVNVNYVDWQYVSSAHGGEECKPTPTPTPQPTPVTPAVVTTKLPTTGAGDVLPIAVATGTGAGLLHRIRSRRQKRQ
jgi:hypothetical protein